MKALAVAAFSLAAFGSSVHAAQEPGYDYVCEIEAKRTGGWTPYQIRFSINETDMTARLDPGLEVVGHDGPVTARVKPRTGGILRLKWRLGLRTTEWDIMSIGYKLDFNPSEKSGRMWVAVPSGGSRDGPGTLRCK